MVGQRVRVFVNDWWQPGVVKNVCPEPNSYVIRLRDGRAFRRTRSAINLDQSTSAGFGAVLPSAEPNPHAAGTAAQPHGNARDREPNPHAAGTAAQPHGNARAFEQMSSAATAVGASVVTPGRSFATVVSGTPVPSPVPAHRVAPWHRDVSTLASTLQKVLCSNNRQAQPDREIPILNNKVP